MIIDDDGYEDEVSSTLPKNTIRQQTIELKNEKSSVVGGGTAASPASSSSSEEMSVPYYETENPLKNRIGDITLSDISPRGHTIMDEQAKKMERRRSLQSKIKKPFRDSINFDLDLNSPTTTNSNNSKTATATTSASQLPPLTLIPKLNLGHLNKYDVDDVSSCGGGSTADDRNTTEELEKSVLSSAETSSTSTATAANSITPKRTLSAASIIAKVKRPHTARESRKELQYIVANNCSSSSSINTNNATTTTSDDHTTLSSRSDNKNKQIAKLLTNNNGGGGVIEKEESQSPPSSSRTTTRTTPQQHLKRHSVAREFNSLQDYLATRFKEQKHFMSSNNTGQPSSSGGDHNNHQTSSSATPRSSALENKLLTMANSLKRTSQVLELNEIKLREERRKSAQAWTLLSIEEDNHSMSQMKFEELRFHYEVKCEELKSSKNKIEQLTSQVKKLEGNYNFLDQEKIRLQREVIELKRTIEKDQEKRKRKCCIM